MVDNQAEVKCETDEYNLTPTNTAEVLKFLDMYADDSVIPPDLENVPISALYDESHIAHLHKPPVLDELDDINVEFNVDLHGSKSGKNTWLYSKDLKKVFIKMNQPFCVEVSYKPSIEPLYLRAMIVYNTPEELHIPVIRCHNHENQSDRTNENRNMVPHILRCTRQDSQYVGTKNGVNFNDRLAVIVNFGIQTNPKPNETKIHETVNYEFVCQNSCATGMNRRSTVVIFTLENDRKEIFGKKLMHFKVCSCPKRDKEKEEGDGHSKRKAEYPPGKKPAKKLCVNTTHIKKEPGLLSPQISGDDSDGYHGNGNRNRNDVTLTITLPDQQSAEHVLRCAFNELAGRMAKDGSKTDLYKPYYKKIKKTMDQFCSQ